MSHEDYLARLRIEAVSVASKILDGEVDLVEGVRKLVSLQNGMENSGDAEFLIFKGLESDTDEFPLGESREHWNQIALIEKDAELKEYEHEMREPIFEACRRFIQKYGG